MGRKRKQTHSLRGWFRRMFRQPPGDFYGRASVYLSGRRMEIEQFRRIRSYEALVQNSLVNLVFPPIAQITTQAAAEKTSKEPP